MDKPKPPDPEERVRAEIDRVSRLSGEDLQRELVRQLVFLNLRLRPVRAVLVQLDGTVSAATNGIRSAIAELKGVILQMLRGRTARGGGP